MCVRACACNTFLLHSLLTVGITGNLSTMNSISLVCCKWTQFSARMAVLLFIGGNLDLVLPYLLAEHGRVLKVLHVSSGSRDSFELPSIAQSIMNMILSLVL